MSSTSSTVTGRGGRCRIARLRRVATSCVAITVLSAAGGLGTPAAAARPAEPAGSLATPEPPPPVPPAPPAAPAPPGAGPGPASEATLPAGLPPIDPGCLHGSWSAPAESLAVLVTHREQRQALVAAANVLNIFGSTYTWEASYTVEQLGAAPPGTVPMPEVVSQTDVWWLQSGELLVADAMMSFTATAQSSSMPATRVFLDDAWVSFPGSGEPPIPGLGTVHARCTADLLELFVPAGPANDASVVTFHRLPPR